MISFLFFFEIKTKTNYSVFKFANFNVLFLIFNFFDKKIDKLIFFLCILLVSNFLFLLFFKEMR